MIGLRDSLISRAGTYFEFDADQKWRTEMHSGFIYELQNLWLQSLRFLHVDVSVRCCILQQVEITHKQG